MLFDRVYRLLIGKKGQSKGLEIENLRIQFAIHKTADKNPNNSSIKVWNLKAATRKELEKPGARCVLYAGYKEDAGAKLIFQGDVTYAWTTFDGPDIITEFELGDGVTEIRDTVISKGYNKNVKSELILKDVAKEMGLPLTLASNAPQRDWKNGLSYHGSARVLLDKVTKATGLEWSIQNGNLQVVEKGMVTTRQGIEISMYSGMIGSPESEREEKSEKGGSKTKSSNTGPTDEQLGDFSDTTPNMLNVTPYAISSKPTTVKSGAAPKKATAAKKAEQPKQYWYGWKVKTLLMPTLNPGDRVSLKARAVDGVFRIEELTHTGDNWEGDWQTELKLVDPAKPLGDKAATATAKGGTVTRGTKPVDKKVSNIAFGPTTA